MDRLRGTDRDGRASGVSSDPAESTTALGRLGADMIVDKSVEAIRKAISTRP